MAKLCINNFKLDFQLLFAFKKLLVVSKSREVRVLNRDSLEKLPLQSSRDIGILGSTYITGFCHEK